VPQAREEVRVAVHAAEAAEDMAAKGETFYGRFAPKKAAA
jgi:hypothetical protein